jgi:hypothetical protein
MAQPAMHILGDDDLKFYKPAAGTDNGSQLSTAESAGFARVLASFNH